MTSVQWQAINSDTSAVITSGTSPLDVVPGV